MESPSTSATIVLERPTAPAGGSAQTVDCAVPVADGDQDGLQPEERSGGLGFVLRAPGLALLAAVFLIEGYRWLGVIHLGTTTVGSFVFGTVGLASVALAAPVAALVLTSGRHASRWVADDTVTLIAVAVTVATGTVLVVGGPASRAVAGTADLALAASALGAVILGERASQRAADWTHVA